MADADRAEPVVEGVRSSDTVPDAVTATAVPDVWGAHGSQGAAFTIVPSARQRLCSHTAADMAAAGAADTSSLAYEGYIWRRKRCGQFYLVEHVTVVNQSYNVLLQQVQQALIGVGQAAGQAQAEINQMLQGQVAVLAYNDVFLITAGLSLLMIPVALLMSGIKTKASGGGH